MYPAELKYSKEHEWIKVEGTRGRIGITHHAQAQLGDVVFVDLPKVGRVLTALETFGVVESVKAVSDVYSQVSGAVVECNGELETHPELVNKDCYGKGWMIVVELANAKELDTLMDAAAYEAYLQSEGAK
jgi:glycine cleavage system H protein